MQSDPFIFDVVMDACLRQAQHPDENGGGIIGRAEAVVKALGLDGDAHLSSLGTKRCLAVPEPSEGETP